MCEVLGTNEIQSGRLIKLTTISILGRAIASPAYLRRHWHTRASRKGTVEVSAYPFSLISLSAKKSPQLYISHFTIFDRNKSNEVRAEIPNPISQTLSPSSSRVCFISSLIKFAWMSTRLINCSQITHTIGFHFSSFHRFSLNIFFFGRIFFSRHFRHSYPDRDPHINEEDLSQEKKCDSEKICLLSVSMLMLNWEMLLLNNK